MQLIVRLPNMPEGAEVFNALGHFKNGDTVTVDDDWVRNSGFLAADEEVPETYVIGDENAELYTIPEEPAEEPPVEVDQTSASDGEGE